MLRVLVIDDHPLIRAGLSAQLAQDPRLTLCGEAANAREARQLTAELQPDVILLDLMLGDEDGLTLLRELCHLAPQARVVVLSMLDPEEYAPRALAAGASHFLHKGNGIEAIVATLAGETDPAATVGETVEATDTTSLSDRELQVFRLVGLGRTTREISAALGISPKTVDAHKEHIKLRLGLANAAQLTARAARWAATRGGPPDP